MATPLLQIGSTWSHGMTPTLFLIVHLEFQYYKQKLFCRMYNPGGMPLQEEPFRLEETPQQLPLIGGRNKFFSGSFHTSCTNRAQLATAWSTRDTCTVCGHPTMSNYFTMYSYKIVGVAVLAFAYHSGYHCYSYYLSD